MASMKLWGVFSLLLMMIGNHISETMDLSSRQMMLVPSFVKQAATPVFFATGNNSPRQDFHPMMFDASNEEEFTPLHLKRPNGPPLSRLQQMNGIQRKPFDIHAAAATPDQRPFLPPLNPLRSVPPTFFIDDDVPFSSIFKVPPRHFQTDLQNSPQHFRPTERHPTRHGQLSQFRPTFSAPQRSPTTLSQSSEETFQREVGPSARRPTTSLGVSSEENVQQEVRQSTTTPWSSGKVFRQERRPTTTLPQPSERFRENMRPTSRRPTILSQSSEEAFRPRAHPTTQQSSPQRHPQTSSEETFRQRPLSTHLLPSVLDSLHGGRDSMFIPGEAGKDYPLFASIPRTGFSCTEDMISNFVADEETRCQVVRVCREDGGVDNFLCPNGTLFDNDSQFCNWWYRVPCGENGNSNHIPHRGRTVSQAERENRLRPEIQSHPRLRHPPRDQNKRPIDHGLDGFFSAIPHSQEHSDFSRGNLDDFFGHPRRPGFEHQPERHEMTIQRPEEARPLPPPLPTFSGTTPPSQTTKRPSRKHRTRKPSPTRAPIVEKETFATIQSDQLDVAEEGGSTKRPTQKQRTRRPSSVRAPKVLHENIEAEDQSNLGSIGSFGLSEESGQLPTRSPIANVRNRGRATFKPRPQRIQTTQQTSLKEEFDPFYDGQSQDFETTTVTDPPTTSRRKLSSRRTTTKRPSTTRRTTTRKSTKLTTSTIRFRHRSTKKPRKPLTAKPSTTTTEEAIVSKDSKISSVTTPVSKTEGQFSRQQDIEMFTHDPFGSSGSEIRSSPFNPQTPVNYDSFYFGPVVTGGFQGSVLLDELPTVVTLPEDTVASRLESIPLTTTTTTTAQTLVATTPTKLRSSPKRRGKGSLRTTASTSTFPSARKSTTSASASEKAYTSKSRSGGRARSKWRTRKTNATTESDHVSTSTVRTYATPRTREQLFPTRHSLMKKTGFGQKQVEVSTVSNEMVEEAQESNKIAVAETTQVVTVVTESNNGTTVIP